VFRIKDRLVKIATRLHYANDRKRVKSSWIQRQAIREESSSRRPGKSGKEWFKFVALLRGMRVRRSTSYDGMGRFQCGSSLSMAIHSEGCVFNTMPVKTWRCRFGQFQPGWRKPTRESNHLVCQVVKPWQGGGILAIRF